VLQSESVESGAVWCGVASSLPLQPNFCKVQNAQQQQQRKYSSFLFLLFLLDKSNYFVLKIKI